MRKAYLNPAERFSPIYELVEHIILPEFGKITVTPKPEFGDPSTYSTLESFIDAVCNELIHPIDAKFAVADAISELLNPINEYFQENPELLEKAFQKYTGYSEKIYYSKIINDLGWFSETSLEGGLNKTYDWFLSNINNLRS